jgi:hypothetical protein
MLVTYSLTIRRLQLEAAKCYTDPDDHLMIKTPTSERLRRHRLSSKRASPSQKHRNIQPKESSNPTTTDNNQNQLQWP